MPEKSLPTHTRGVFNMRDVTESMQGLGLVGDLDVQADQYEFSEVGDGVRGVLVSVQVVPMEDQRTKEQKDVFKYTLNVGSKEQAKYLWFWGNVKLDTKLPLVPLGTDVIVVYEFEQDLGGGRAMKVFNVYTVDGKRIAPPPLTKRIDARISPMFPDSKLAPAAEAKSGAEGTVKDKLPF